VYPQSDRLLDCVYIQRVQIDALMNGQHSHERPGHLLAAYGDAPQMLDLQDEALDQIGLTDEREVTMDRGDVGRGGITVMAPCSVMASRSDFAS
jgi:hypothetical protein